MRAVPTVDYAAGEHNADNRIRTFAGRHVCPDPDTLCPRAFVRIRTLGMTCAGSVRIRTIRVRVRTCAGSVRIRTYVVLLAIHM